MRPVVSDRLAVAILAISFAAVSIAAKVVAYDRPTLASDNGLGRMRETLKGQGWAELGIRALNETGDLHLALFKAPDCDGPVAMTALPSSGEGAHLLDHAAGSGDRVSFLYRGEVTSAPPSLAYIRDRFSFAADRLGLIRLHYAPLVAIVEPADCRVDVDLASKLRSDG